MALSMTKKNKLTFIFLRKLFVVKVQDYHWQHAFCAGNTKEGSIIVLLTSCLTGLDYSVLQIKTKIVSCHTADSKPVKQEVKQEVNSIVIIPPLVFPDFVY